MALIVSSCDGSIGRLVLNRPDKRNALNAGLVREAIDAILQLEQAGAIVCLLEATPPTFCAGADLSEQTEGNPPLELIEAIGASSMIFVAVVHGGTLGVGVALVDACQLVVASDDAWFALPEFRIGFFPQFVYDRLLPTMGRRHALGMTLSNRKLDAEAAVPIGLVNVVCPTDALGETALTWAIDIAQTPGVAAEAKRAWRTSGCQLLGPSPA
jgi:enoyl-CoA hydratase/carnithine racemase